MTKLCKTLLARMDKAAWEYKMFQENDRVLVACSGGADSMAVLDLLAQQIFVYGENITLCAVYVDLGFGEHSDVRCQVMEKYFKQLRIEYKIVRTDIGPYSHSDANRENPCFLCSRIRRKNIFETAEELNCNKIVFGHHKDDIIETLLMNMIYNREISTMTPAMQVFQGKYTVLRPMVYMEEALVKKYIHEKKIKLIDQECPTDGHSKREFIKQLLANLETEIPGANQNIFASMKRVKLDYLL